MAQASRDQNYVTTLLAVSSVDGVTPVTLYANPTTHRLLVDLAGGGSGTVQTISIATANGFAGTSDGDPNNPELTLSTTVTGIVKGNGTAISAAVAGDVDSILPTQTGNSGKYLTTNGTTSSWATVSGSGDVVGPGSATDNALVLFDGTTGKLVKNSTVSLVTGVLAPVTTDTVSLGSTTLMWSDLFLASGSVINWNNGDLTLTHSANTLTLAGGDLALGANNLTLTGSIASTGSRSTKGWFTDLDVTNAITGSVTGNAATVTWANEASDTTCFIGFATAASGNLAPKTNTNMTFNSSTGVATFASTVLTTTDINGGTIDGTSIGASSASTIIGTTIQANTGFLPDTDGGAYLGQPTQAFSNLYLDTTATINFDNGNAVITHSSGILTVSTGDFRVTTAGTNTASVVTVGGTQTLTSKTLTSPTITTASLSGVQLLAEGASLGLDPSLSADGTWTGITMTGTAGYTQAFGDVVYLDPTDSRWEACDANAASGADGDSRGLVGIVVVAGTDGNSCTVLLNGVIRADAKFPTFTVNNPIYISETAGSVTQTQPTTTDVVIRVLGAALTTDAMYFNPDFAYITHT